jgi:zinc protease
MARVLPSEFQQTLLGVAYKITGFDEADTPYLDLLSGVLGGGDASRLYRSVKDRQQLVHSIGSSSYTPRDPGLFMVDAVLDPIHLEQSVRAIAQEVHRLRDLGASDAEVERARVNLLASKVHERETMEGQANNLGYYESIGGGIEQEEAYLEAVRRATSADLLRVARTYLAPERARVVAVLEKGAAQASDQSLVQALQDGSGAGRTQYAGTEIDPGIWRYQLPNGLRVIIKPVHSIPLVSLHLALRGGQLAESRDRQGLSSFLAEMLERGTTQRSSAQFAAEVEDIAGNLSGFAGRNSFGLQAQFLKESLDSGLELLADALLHPALDPKEIEKVRQEYLAAIKRREDSLTSKALELLQKGLYDAHPYAFLTLGTEASISRINRDALNDYLAAYAHPANAVLAVVGDVDPGSMIEAIGAHLGEWSGPGSVSIPTHTVPALRRVQELSVAKQRNQVHVMLGFPGLRVDDPDVPALHVLTQILSGQGGRLFLELRDRQSLAYQVQASSVEGLDPGMFMVYIASAPEKEQQAREGIRSQLVQLLAGGVTDDELERARSYLIGSNAVSLQRFGTQASLLSLDELYGMGATYHLGYAERIDKVTRDDVMRVARRIIDLDHAVYAVVR